jgi:hypothetical protein
MKSDTLRGFAAWRIRQAKLNSGDAEKLRPIIQAESAIEVRRTVKIIPASAGAKSFAFLFIHKFISSPAPVAAPVSFPLRR